MIYKVQRARGVTRVSEGLLARADHRVPKVNVDLKERLARKAKRAQTAL